MIIQRMMRLKCLSNFIRPYQWIKNLIILVPLVFGQKLLDIRLFLECCFMVFIFSLAASSVYLINDIVDLKEDKQHQEKKKRPLASGQINIYQAVIVAFILGVVSVLIAFALNGYAGWIVLFYIGANYIYAKSFKSIPILDILCIALFFYLRILLGSVVIQIMPSNWIILSAILLALFLVLNKRRHDLELSKVFSRIHKRYTIYFVDCAIYVVLLLIIVVYALYTIDAVTVNKFGTNYLIYTIPCVYYGLFRYLYLVNKRSFPRDPVYFLHKDRIMQLNLITWISLCIIFIYFV